MLAARALSLHMTGRARPPAQLTCPTAGYTEFETCWVHPGRDVAGSSGAFALVTASQIPGCRSASLSCWRAQPGRSRWHGVGWGASL